MDKNGTVIEIERGVKGPGHRGYTQRSSFLLKVRNQLSNLAGSLASALRRGRHPPLIVILNV